jgi:putative transposase
MHCVRLYPSSTQEAKLRFTFDATRQLYNALLQERRDAWRGRKISVSAKHRSSDTMSLEDAHFEL